MTFASKLKKVLKETCPEINKISINRQHYSSGGGACLEHEQAFLEKKKARNKKASANRRDRDDAMASLGLTKVRSVSGKVYYE